MKLITRRLPSPIAGHDNQYNDRTNKTPSMPTTLRAAVSIFSETKILTENSQEFDIAVDIEGVLHRPMPLPDTTFDIIFVLDNG